MKNFSAQTFLMTAGGVFLSMLTVAALVAIIIGLLSTRSYQERNTTINVQGTGEVFVQPDIADFSFTVQEEAATVEAAQQSVSETIAKISTGLEALEIADTDIKTQNYSSNPRYEWREKECSVIGSCETERVLVGYELQQSVNVTVRNLDQAGAVLSLLGSSGVDNLNGPNLRVEDTDAARIAAREQAIEKAKLEAQDLATALNVNLGKMVDFYEDNNGGGYPQPMYSGKEMMMDMAVASVAPEFVPEIQAGEDRVSSTVHLTFKIK